MITLVNTFTEHRGSVWSVKDMQHTYVTNLFDDMDYLAYIHSVF